MGVDADLAEPGLRSVYSCESLLKTLGDGDRPRGVKRMRGMAAAASADGSGAARPARRGKLLKMKFVQVVKVRTLSTSSTQTRTVVACFLQKFVG